MVVCKQSAAVQPILEFVTQWLRDRQLAVFVEPSTYTRLVRGGGTGTVTGTLVRRAQTAWCCLVAAQKADLPTCAGIHRG